MLVVVPYIKSFLNDELQGQKPSNILGKEYGTTKSGSIEIRELFGSREVFSYPKPSTLIKRLIKIGTKKDSIILDFFSGSGTTADAVIRENGEDNGMRKFILVQIPEKCNFRSEAFQLGFDNICSIAEKRIEIVGKKIKEETNVDIDYGFRVYKVDSTNMKDVYYTANDLEQSNIGEFKENIKEDRTTDDLLTQVILDLGLSLDLSIEEKMLGKNKVYYVAENLLVACFDNNIDIDIVDKICECEPYKVVFKDSAFKTDNDKINLEERFKKLLPQRASDKGFISIL
jgi:adenine specific DNA methylase mod